MQINNVSPNFGAKVRIEALKNQEKPYLYSQVLNIVKENQITSVFKTKAIDLEIPKDDKKANEAIINSLNDAGIKFDIIG